jgi:2-hydroxycyclohexanecarboxyl-CoA dehydrogenase
MSESSFSSSVALVTASTSGIGAAIAMHLAQAGVRGLIVNGRQAEAGRDIGAKLKQLAPRTETIFVQADLTDAGQVEQLFQRAEQAFGQLDIFVHCGGAQVPPGLFSDLDPASFRTQIDGHFTSLLFCSHHAVRMMMARKSGVIIAVASDAGKIATPAESVIGATKAAAIMFIRTIALELARHGIRANSITPSIVRNTKSHTRLMAGEIGRKVFEKAETRARLGVPVPDDVAPLAVFLASPQASRITGQTISVNGGISAA